MSIWDMIAGLRPRTPEEGFAHAIGTWEGGFQQFSEDAGNWVRLPDGTRRLIGTNLGVTPGALANHRGVEPATITVQDMKALKVEEAVAIGMAHYYRVGWERLDYSPAVEVWVDIGWGSGPRTAIKYMQRMIGVGDDGIIGGQTEKAWYDWLYRGEAPSLDMHARAVKEIAQWRRNFYRRITEIRPANAKFLQGWLNRANHYLPGTEWWKEWTWT